MSLCDILNCTCATCPPGPPGSSLVMMRYNAIQFIVLTSFVSNISVGIDQLAFESAPSSRLSYVASSEAYFRKLALCMIVKDDGSGGGTNTGTVTASLAVYTSSTSSTPSVGPYLFTKQPTTETTVTSNIVASSVSKVCENNSFSPVLLNEGDLFVLHGSYNHNATVSSSASFQLIATLEY